VLRIVSVSVDRAKIRSNLPTSIASDCISSLCSALLETTQLRCSMETHHIRRLDLGCQQCQQSSTIAGNKHGVPTFLLLRVGLLACHGVGFDGMLRLCFGVATINSGACFTIGVVGLRLCRVLSAGEGLMFCCSAAAAGQTHRAGTAETLMGASAAG
jgi:hypothetical protein